MQTFHIYSIKLMVFYNGLITIAGSRRQAVLSFYGPDAMMVAQLRNQNLLAIKIQNWIALIVLLLFPILKAKTTGLSPVSAPKFS
ncbi:MAG: hypothetical protein II413_13150 [Treponema sp.]|nr:hypothetical protein [Treponema sp.]